MTPAEYYTEVNTKSQLVDSLWDEIVKPEAWIPFDSFIGKDIDKSIWEKDSFLNSVSKKYILRVGVLSIPPNKVYKWHVDTNTDESVIRKMGINMLLSNSPSHTLFTNECGDSRLLNIIELVYQPDTYYIFNTEQRHMVVNLNTTRYLLSIALLGEYREGMNDLYYDKESAVTYTNFVKELTEGGYE